MSNIDEFNVVLQGGGFKPVDRMAAKYAVIQVKAESYPEAPVLIMTITITQGADRRVILTVSRQEDGYAHHLLTTAINSLPGEARLGLK